MPRAGDCQSNESEIPLVATWRRRRPALLRPTCSLDSAKSSRAVTEKKEVVVVVGISFWTLELEIRCSLCGLWREQAGSASAAGFSDEWSQAHNFFPVLLSLPPLLDFSVGFFFLRQNVLDFYFFFILCQNVFRGIATGAGRQDLRRQHGRTNR